jgi:U4/U6 small nuclear ribonucleoprotein PRP3
MYLTAQERKKLRRRKRSEKEQQKQDRIKLGLQAPPPPKVKLSNMMRILGDEQVVGPSEVEREVRRQVEERIVGHKGKWIKGLNVGGKYI